MAREIERKFLVSGGLPEMAAFQDVITLKQAYLFDDGKVSARIRWDSRKPKAELTFKVRISDLERTEITLEISADEAEQLLPACGSIVSKRRYLYKYHGHIWEIDVFSGDNEGLMIAEIELDDPKEEFDIPDFVGEEVTRDPRYLNANLASNPFMYWGGSQAVHDAGDEDDGVSG